MKYTVDKNSEEKTYIQIYNQIREDIISGIFKLGDKLPSKRQLAFDTNTSVITIEHSYSILIEEGYIESRQRSGYFVIYQDKDWFMKVEKTEGETTLKHTIPHDDTISFNLLSKTARKVLSDYQDELLFKSPNLGCDILKKAIANYLRRNRGIDVHTNQIVIGSGSEYLYGLVVQILGKDRIYALENPSYDKIRKVYESNGAKIELLKMGKDGVKTTELNNSCASVLHVTPYNSFPSGISASASKRREYVHFAQSRNGFIIEDDYDSEFGVSSKIVDTIYSLDQKSSVIYINSFSKTIAPSIRVGYMILPEDCTDSFLKKINFYSCTVPTFEQYLIAELINSGDFERHINKLRRKRRRASK